MALRFLPLATKRELAALHPRAIYRQGTEDICICQAREHEFVPGSSLPAASQVAAHRPQMILDWHSSRSLFQSNQFSLSKTLLVGNWRRFTHLKCPLLTRLPTYYTIYDFSSQADLISHMNFLFLALFSMQHAQTNTNWYLAQFFLLLISNEIFPSTFYSCNVSRTLCFNALMSRLFNIVSGFCVSPITRNQVSGCNPIMLETWK